MSTLTASRTGTSTLARINLLPPEIEEDRRFRRVQLGLGAGVAASVLAVAGLFVVANNQVGEAQGQLADAKRETGKLESQATAYAQVPLVYSRVEAARAQLELAMGKEIRWSFYLNDLSLKIPNRVWLTNMTFASVEAAPAVGAPAPVPAGPGAAPANYVTPGVGAVTFEGDAMRHNDVAAWLDSLAKQKGYDQVYFTEATNEEIGDTVVVKFKSQVTITEDALSKRYTQKAGS